MFCRLAPCALLTLSALAPIASSRAESPASEPEPQAPMLLAGHPHPTTAPEADTITVTSTRRASLTAPDARAARLELEHVPGSASVVEADAWRDTGARTLKDVLEYTAGVFVQPKWGEDSRLSIRGSGLSRNFHLRGVQLLVDGIPMNAADGSADFQEIDPTAFAYSEVYKGANALRYGASSLGGALNFVSPTGMSDDGLRLRADAGSFDLYRTQLAAGGQRGALDAHASASGLHSGGFRDHSQGESFRGSANLGWRVNPNVETRLYVLGADIEQRIPGSLTREQALHARRTAAVNNVSNDYQRNMQSWRVASKTGVQLGATTIEFGGYLVEKRLIHPIFQYLDYDYQDRGGFLRSTFDTPLFGYDNRFVFGVNVFDGHVDNQQFQNLGGEAGTLLSAAKDSSDNLALYAENQISLRPTLTLIAGIQYLDASREREDRFDDATNTSGRMDYDLTSPKLGLIWRYADSAQLYTNLSRSGEAPTFGELNFTNAALADTRAQRATTLEVGTRGRRGELGWDVAAYRAELRDEFQFFDLGNGQFAVENADDTVHQGLELALDWTWAHDLLAAGDHASFKLAYAFNDFFFDDDAQWGRNELPGAPRHVLRSEWKWTHARGAYLAPNIEWVPEGYDVDNANTVQTRAYALLGLRAGYDPGARWSVYVDARNLADTKYIASSSVAAVASPTSALFEPGEGFAVVAGVNLRW